MEDGSESHPLIPAPRHLRKRRFHREIPDTLLVRQEPVAAVATEDSQEPEEEERPINPREAARRRKRTVALALIILVSVSIPALLLALVLIP